MKTDKLLQLIQQKKVMRSGGALPLPKAKIGSAGPCPPGLVKNAKGECVLQVTDPNDPRLRAFADSADVYNLSKKLSRIYPNLKPISKEKYEEIQKKDDKLPYYDIDQVGYNEDKKKGIKKPLNEYVYKRDKGNYDDPTYVKNNKKELDKYSDNVEDYIITLPNGDIKYPGTVYDGKPDWSHYAIDTPNGTTRMYSTDDKTGKPKLDAIYPSNIKPIKTHYYGSDVPVSFGNVTLSSTGWYQGQKPPDSKKLDEYKNYGYLFEDMNEYKKPVIKVELTKNPIIPPVPPININPIISENAYDGLDLLPKEETEVVQNDPIFMEGYDDISPVTLPSIRMELNPKFDNRVDKLPNRKKEAVVDALGNPRYKYWYNDGKEERVIGESEYNKLKSQGYRDGGSLPRAVTGNVGKCDPGYVKDAKGNCVKAGAYPWSPGGKYYRGNNTGLVNLKTHKSESKPASTTSAVPQSNINALVANAMNLNSSMPIDAIPDTKNQIAQEIVNANTPVANRNDATIAPEGSVRSYVQKVADYMSHAGDAKVDEDGNIINAGTPFDPLMKYVGAPILQSGVNIANTIMGDRPVRNDADIEGLGWDAFTLLPFVDAAASGGKSLFSRGKSLYNTVATGNSPLPIAWKVEKTASTPRSSQYITRAYTDKEAELLHKYGDGMYNLTPEDWKEFEKLTKSGVTDFSKQKTPITRQLGYYLNNEEETNAIKNLKLWEDYKYSQDKNIRTWSASSNNGVGTRMTWDGKVAEPKTRLVIPSRYTADLGNNFAAMPYYDKRIPFIWNPETGRINSAAVAEKELMGNLPNGFKVIGKSSDDGFNNIIIKPLTKRDGGSLPIAVTGNQGQCDPGYYWNPKLQKCVQYIWQPVTVSNSQVMAQPGPTQAKADLINIQNKISPLALSGAAINKIAFDPKKRPTVDFIDKRVNDPVVKGKKIEATRHHDVKDVKREEINKIINQANVVGVSPTDLATIILWESQGGKTDRNLGHDLHGSTPTIEGLDDYSARANIAAQALQRELNRGKRLYPQGPFYKQMQAYQGYGPLYPHTEKRYYKHNNQAFFGIPVSMDNPLRTNVLFPYGKTIENFRDSVVIPTLNEYGFKYEEGGELTSEKALQMLHDGTANGKPLTAAQKRYFGYIANKNKTKRHG